VLGTDSKLFLDLTISTADSDGRDPQILIPFVEALYDGGPFLQAVPKALSPDGIFLCQVGEAPGIDDPAAEASVDRNRANFFKSLIKLGFQGTRDYEEVTSLDRQGMVWFRLFISNMYPCSILRHTEDSWRRGCSMLPSSLLLVKRRGFIQKLP
jgi:hypothetical protein